MLFKKTKKKLNIKELHLNDFLAFDYNETATFFNDNPNDQHFIKMIRILDTNTLNALNENSFAFIMKQFQTVLEEFQQFKIFKLLRKPKLAIDIEKKYQLIQQINQAFYASTYLDNTSRKNLLTKKLQLLNLINLKTTETVDWINEEKQIYLLFEEKEEELLNNKINNLISIFNKVGICFEILTAENCFNTIKSILNKNDVIDSTVLEVDSRISKQSLFNIESLNDQKTHLVINKNKYLSFWKLNLNSLFKTEALLDFFNHVPCDFVLTFHKHHTSSFNQVNFTMINAADSVTIWNQNNAILKQAMKQMDFKFEILLYKQLTSFYNLILNRGQLTYDQLKPAVLDQVLNFELMKTNQITTNPLTLIGFNNFQELLYLNDRHHFLNIGPLSPILFQLLNQKMIRSERVIIFDYQEKFDDLNHYYQQPIIDLTRQTINIFELKENDNLAEQVKTKVTLICNLFQMLDTRLNTDDLSNLDNVISQLYLSARKSKPVKGKTTKSKSKAKPKLKTKISFQSLLAKLKEKKQYAKLVTICQFLAEDPVLSHLFGETTTIKINQHQVLSFNLQVLKSKNHHNWMVSATTLFLLNHFLLENLEQKQTTIYFDDLSTIISQPLLIEQLQIFLKNSDFNVYGYCQKDFLNLNDQNLMQTLKMIDYLNLIPQQDNSNDFWTNLLTKLGLHFSTIDNQKLNTINDQEHLLVVNSKKYWYHHQIFEFEKRAWTNKILDRYLSKYEVNKILRGQIDELETKIYYTKQAKTNLINEFLIRNSFDDEVQKKIISENEKYIKKLF